MIEKVQMFQGKEKTNWNTDIHTFGINLNNKLYLNLDHHHHHHDEEQDQDLFIKHYGSSMIII